MPACEVIQKTYNINYADEDGMSFLIIASAKGNKALCEMLIDKGAVLDWQAKDGMNALLAAAMQQHPIVVKLLLGKGADPNLKSNEVKTAYDYALNRDIKAILTAYRKEE